MSARQAALSFSGLMRYLGPSGSPSSSMARVNSAGISQVNSKLLSNKLMLNNVFNISLGISTFG